jgi:hypothetical protein
MQLGLSPAERSVIRDAVRLGRTCAYPLEGAATALMHTDASTASASRPRPRRQSLHSMPVKAQGCQPDYCNHLCRSRYVQLRFTLAMLRSTTMSQTGPGQFREFTLLEHCFNNMVGARNLWDHDRKLCFNNVCAHSQHNSKPRQLPMAKFTIFVFSSIYGLLMGSLYVKSMSEPIRLSVHMFGILRGYRS